MSITMPDGVRSWLRSELQSAKERRLALAERHPNDRRNILAIESLDHLLFNLEHAPVTEKEAELEALINKWSDLIAHKNFVVDPMLDYLQGIWRSEAFFTYFGTVADTFRTLHEVFDGAVEACHKNERAPHAEQLLPSVTPLNPASAAINWGPPVRSNRRKRGPKTVFITGDDMPTVDEMRRFWSDHAAKHKRQTSH